MTWALCFNCGEVKFGAICPCPKCQVASTGNMELDIAFSDHRLARETLAALGGVIAAIREVSDDGHDCFWAFLRYVSTVHSSILRIDIQADLEARCDRILQEARLPEVTLRASPAIERAARQESAGAPADAGESVGD